MKIPSFIFSWLFMAGLLQAQEKRTPETRPVVPEALTATILQADRLVVSEATSEEDKTLFESRKREDIQALANAAVVEKPQEWFHCMCDGTPLIRLYKENQVILAISNHHGVSLRCSLWSSDADISTKVAWLKWFDDRGMPKPAKEYEEMEAEDKKWEMQRQKWLAAMPESIRPLWDKAEAASLEHFLLPGSESNIGPLRKAIEASMPDPKAQVLVLLSWLGSGAELWSGTPSYEVVAEELLLDYPLSIVFAAVKSTELTPVQMEGLAKFLGRWSFSQSSPESLGEVPKEIKKLLWDHYKNTKDKDKLQRAERAFKPRE